MPAYAIKNYIQCDLTKEIIDLGCEVDLVTMIFVLSAINPDKFLNVLEHLAQKMKKNGKLLFRDYAINDHAMIRFKSGSKVHYTLPVAVYIYIQSLPVFLDSR